MIKTTNILMEELHDYASPKSKLSRMVRNEEIFPIVKGLYETDRSVSPYLLAGSIYGPSYVSFEFALGYYGLIPEAVYVVTCATYDKKKKKYYDTPFGSFSYRDVPPQVFPYEVDIKQEGEYYFWIATPEKALCDQVYTVSPVANIKEMGDLLTEDLRIDVEDLRSLDLETVAELAEIYHSTNVRKFASYLRRISR